MRNKRPNNYHSIQTSPYLLKLKNILFFLILVFTLAGCKVEDTKPKVDYLALYVQPDYPKKPAGRFLKDITYQYPPLPAVLNLPFQSGIKVELFFNTKNYVDYFKIYRFGADSVGRVVRVEYNITGLVSRIKY